MYLFFCLVIQAGRSRPNIIHSPASPNLLPGEYVLTVHQRHMLSPSVVISPKLRANEDSPSKRTRSQTKASENANSQVPVLVSPGDQASWTRSKRADWLRSLAALRWSNYSLVPIFVLLRDLHLRIQATHVHDGSQKHITIMKSPWSAIGSFEMPV